MTVWNTIANMRTLDASIISFFRVLEEQISDQDSWRLGDSEEAASSSFPNGWCRYASYIRYPLRRVPKGEGRNRGPANLTVGVELWREVANQGDVWQYASEPLIYVGFCPEKSDWWDDGMACDYRGIPVQFADGQIVPPTENTPYLWTWNGENEDDRWSLRNWFFVLEMFSITDRENIQKDIIGPLCSLIVDNADGVVAFEGTTVIRTGPQDQ